MKLTNNILSIEVAEHGAELISLKKENCEYMWSGDTAFWNRHAPILFPVVGKPYNNALHIDGKTYPMKQHGFARDSEFESIGVGRLHMLDTGHAEQYPYRFSLEVEYRLDGNKVEITWTVTNRDQRDMHFQIGAHPGFMLPDYNAADKVHGYVRYYDKDGASVCPVITSALDDGNRIPLPAPRNIPAIMPLEADTFAHDALMLEGGQVTKAVLCDKEGNEVLAVNCPQAEAYGIWAPHKEGCPFVCLEPWCGICDVKGFAGDISQRTYVHLLAPGEQYQFTYIITVQ